MTPNRPHTTVILAMSADGKIADVTRAPARFGSETDKAHLETQIAMADATLFGAGTLRAYGTTITVSHPQLLQHRTKAGKQKQPVHIVATPSAQLNPEWRFFQQPIQRWLLTTTSGKMFWQERSDFQEILVFETPAGGIDFQAALRYLVSVDITRLAILGGGQLVAAMLELNLIDELWLTVCPLILGGATAPTPVAGKGFTPELAPRLELMEVKTVGQEVFLHYRMQQPSRLH